MPVNPIVRVLDEVASTNDEVRALGLAGAPHGSSVAARRQTAGRGRRGHAWASPKGNLYLSVLLRPSVPPSKLPGLAAACGLGVLDGLVDIELANAPQLKWPNDILARGRKLGGILVEAGRDVTGDTFAVCGVGVNVERAPTDLGAISLADLGATPSLSALSERLREGIVARADAWAAAGGIEPLAGIRDEYVSALAWRGEKVHVLAPNGTLLTCGSFETVDLWGRAVVDGVAYASELASLRPPAHDAKGAGPACGTGA